MEKDALFGSGKSFVERYVELQLKSNKLDANDKKEIKKLLSELNINAENESFLNKIREDLISSRVKSDDIEMVRRNLLNMLNTTANRNYVNILHLSKKQITMLKNNFYKKTN